LHGKQSIGAMINNKKMDDKKPYISVIMAARNDNYQGDALIRLQMVITSLICQAKKYNLRAELIMIDWNPPPEKPLLKDVLCLPADLGPLVIRFIVVPPAIHKIYRSSKKMNVIFLAAMNVGIRRAKGEFLWPTNCDLLFSDELIQFLASEKMQKDCFYRVFRHSVNENILELKDGSPEQWINYCKKNIVFIHPKSTVPLPGLEKYPVLQTATGGDFIVFSREKWLEMNGYVQLNNLGGFTDWMLCYICYLAGLKEEVLPGTMRVYHIDHARHTKQRVEFSKGVINTLRYKIFPKMDDKNKIKISIRAINNFKNKVSDFFYNIFYSLFGKLIRKYGPPGTWDRNLRYLYWEFYKILLDMLEGKRPYAYNDENWGMPKENFEEFIIYSKK